MTENTAIIKIIDEITACRNITLEQLHMLLETDDMQAVDYLRKRASEKAHETYGNQVFIRGLIEFTNYCKNDCLYCGIRHSNTHADRYRLSTEQIMACCESGYELGFRTFVLQGGEDPYYTDERICEIVSGIKAKYPDTHNSSPLSSQNIIWYFYHIVKSVTLIYIVILTSLS